MDDLKPCPFCGNSAEISTGGGGDLASSTVYCILCKTDDCLCNSFDSAFYTMTEAIRAWNTRADLPNKQPDDSPQARRIRRKLEKLTTEK